MKKNHKNKFKTPEGYFDSFNERLMDKIAMEESNIPKADGFSLPEGYFTTLNDRVSARLDETEPKVIALKSYKKSYYIAASIAVLAVLALAFYWNNASPFSFEDLASAEIDAYFDTTDMKLSSYEIAEVVSIDELELNDVLENKLDHEHILEYLDENISDIEELDLENEYYE
ncbi:MAG: hypothetical protein ABJN84_05290 [Flavobacteriaceae bacterium]